MICPACHCNDSETIDSVDVADLTYLYSKGFNVDISTYLAGVATIQLRRCLCCDLRFFDPPCAGDSAFYEQLQTLSWYYLKDKPEYVYAAALIGPDARVLEVGCGAGSFRAHLHQSVDYTGLEFNEEAIRKCRTAGLNVLGIDVETLAASTEEAYDVVCSFQVLEHVTDPASFIHSSVCLTRPGGTLLVAVPAEDSYLSIASNATTNMPPHHLTRWSDRALLMLAERNSLTVVDLWHEPIAPFHEEFVTRVFARHWLASHGVVGHGLIDLSRRARAAGFLLNSSRAIRGACASAAARRLEHSQRGHTVVLVASRAEV